MTRTNQITIAVGSLLALLLVWDTIATARLDSRVAALEATAREAADAHTGDAEGTWPSASNDWHRPRRVAARAKAHPGSRAGGPHVAPADGNAAPGSASGDAAHPAAKATPEERRKREEERARRFKAAIHEQALAFAKEKGLDEDTTQKVVTELDGLEDDIHAYRQDVDDGNMSWPAARQEIQARRKDTLADLDKILGADLASELESRVFPRQSAKASAPAPTLTPAPAPASAPTPASDP